MQTSLSWSKYLDAKVDELTTYISQQQCYRASHHQRQMLSELVARLAPRSVACLGAGYLNDIPLDALLTHERDITLVDWIHGISRQGLAGKIIYQQNDEYDCLFCRNCIGARYCKNFTDQRLDDGVCSAFVPVIDHGVSCKNFEPHDQPNFVTADITAGYGSHFAQTMEKRISHCKTPKEAFVKAIKLCDQGTGHYQPIPLADDSIDLLTSSLVVSQFEMEPYGYFSVLLEQYYGRDKLMSLESILAPLMEQLRTRLFVNQIRHHVKELYRLVKKDGQGRVYFSVELFRCNAYDDGYFLVQDMPKALDVLGEYFLFDFVIMQEPSVLHRADIDDGTSIFQNYLLIPKSH